MEIVSSFWIRGDGESDSWYFFSRPSLHLVHMVFGPCGRSDRDIRSMAMISHRSELPSEVGSEKEIDRSYDREKCDDEVMFLHR